MSDEDQGAIPPENEQPTPESEATHHSVKSASISIDPSERAEMGCFESSWWSFGSSMCAQKPKAAPSAQRLRSKCRVAPHSAACEQGAGW